MWQTHLVMDDEMNEGVVEPERMAKDSPAAEGFCVTYIVDIQSLEKPFVSGLYKSTSRSVDHNQYVYDGLSYQSNYQAGLRILDVSSIPEVPDGSKVEEIGYFDVYPNDDALPGGGEAQWNGGTWSAFTFPSGYVVVNTIDRGAFVVMQTGGKGKGQYWG